MHCLKQESFWHAVAKENDKSLKCFVDEHCTNAKPYLGLQLYKGYKIRIETVETGRIMMGFREKVGWRCSRLNGSRLDVHCCGVHNREFRVFFCRSLAP